MSVAKIIEVSARSKKGFEQAIKKGLDKAGSSLKNVRGAWVQEQKVEVDGKDLVYVVNMKVTFVLDD